MADFSRQVEAVRRFNRLYTRQIGLLENHLLQSPFSLTQARILYELGQQKQTSATALRNKLKLDAGYLSRTLSGLRQRGLIETTASEADRRQSRLWLSKQGHDAFVQLNTASGNAIGTMLSALSEQKRKRLIRAMDVIEKVFGTPSEHKVAVSVRPHRCGDMGWILHRHGILYYREYGWDARFETLVAEIVAGFLQHYDPKRERCWIAERDGEKVGSVFLVKQPEQPETVAKLRLLLVEPKARGMGIGQQLVNECTQFARRAGYQRITLWTNSVLDAARHIYMREGYRLIHEEPHAYFGHDLTGQTWELKL